ncbi:hypothetical protein H1R20_g13175, partial [Candolleomyces eurysporus]
MAEPTQEREVTVYWDLENCAVPRDGDCATFCQGLRRLAQRFGEVVTIVAYLGTVDGKLPQFPSSREQRKWQALKDYGVRIKCIKRSGRREDADRAMISESPRYSFKNGQPLTASLPADMILSMEDAPCNKTAILVSGDRDFTLPVSACTAKGMSVVLIADERALGRLGHLSQAVRLFAWPVDVVEAARNPVGPASVPHQYPFKPLFYSFD